jgi:uncharacterized protein with HEPN domain
MMVRDPLLAVEDVLRELDLLRLITDRHGAESFQKDEVDLRAAAYAIQSISEAVRHIPEAWQAEALTLPWPAIRAIGNRIRHEYFRLNGRIIWEVMTKDAITLRIAMEQLLKRHQI